MSMVYNETLDELLSIEKLNDEDLFAAFLTEEDQIPTSDNSISTSHNDSNSFHSTHEGFAQSSSEEVTDTPQNASTPLYNVEYDRDYTHDNTQTQYYGNYEG